MKSSYSSDGNDTPVSGAAKGFGNVFNRVKGAVSSYFSDAEIAKRNESMAFFYSNPKQEESVAPKAERVLMGGQENSARETTSYKAADTQPGDSINGNGIKPILAAWKKAKQAVCSRSKQVACGIGIGLVLGAAALGVAGCNSGRADEIAAMKQKIASVEKINKEQGQQIDDLKAKDKFFEEKCCEISKKIADCSNPCEEKKSAGVKKVVAPVVTKVVSPAPVQQAPATQVPSVVNIYDTDITNNFNLIIVDVDVKNNTEVSDKTVIKDTDTTTITGGGGHHHHYVEPPCPPEEPPCPPEEPPCPPEEPPCPPEEPPCPPTTEPGTGGTGEIGTGGDQGDCGGQDDGSVGDDCDDGAGTDGDQGDGSGQDDNSVEDDCDDSAGTGSENSDTGNSQIGSQRSGQDGGSVKQNSVPASVDGAKETPASKTEASVRAEAPARPSIAQSFAANTKTEPKAI